MAGASPAHQAAALRAGFSELPELSHSTFRLCLARQRLPRPDLRLRIFTSSPALRQLEGVLHQRNGNSFMHLVSALSDDSVFRSNGADDREGELLYKNADSVSKEFTTVVTTTDEEKVETYKNSMATADDAGDGKESMEKLMGVLRDTVQQLKKQAEKAKVALAVMAQKSAEVLVETAEEAAEKSKDNLSYIAENAPDPIREIADTALTAHSVDGPHKVSRIHDFCLGIPYGTLLVVGGFLWFLLSGSTAAIRFGVILGGFLLALSVSSLGAWKADKSSSIFIKGQAALASIIMVREIRRLFEVRSFIPHALMALASTGMVGFYWYVYFLRGNPPKKAKEEGPAV